jgi:hypothetical protein
VKTIKHSLALATVITLCSSAAWAQQYHVELALAGGMVTQADFRPCPPGQGVLGQPAGDCGAKVGRAAKSKGTLYGLTTRAMSATGRDSVTIEDGKLRIKPLDGRTPPVVLLRIGTGTVRGVVISADSHYAFAVVENASGNPSDVMMIDLVTQNGVAGVSLDSQVLGIAMAR